MAHGHSRNYTTLTDATDDRWNWALIPLWPCRLRWSGLTVEKVPDVIGSKPILIRER
jgi:hypothetical protein